MKYRTLKIRDFGNEEVNSILASELHEKLGVKTKFTDWLKREITNGMFDENIDYILVWGKFVTKSNELKFEFVNFNGNAQQASRNELKRNAIITLDTAKEISMMSKTEAGKESRKYFINVEKVAKKEIGEDKLLLEIEKLKTEERLLQEEITDRRIARVEMLQRLGCNFDPVSLVETGRIKSKLSKEVGEAITDAVSDIRVNVPAKSTTEMLKEFNINVLTKDFNNYLLEIGILSEYNYNGIKKEISKDYRWYGYNKHSSSKKKYPVVPMWYVDRFSKLLTIVRNEGYID